MGAYYREKQMPKPLEKRMKELEIPKNFYQEKTLVRRAPTVRMPRSLDRGKGRSNEASFRKSNNRSLSPAKSPRVLGARSSSIVLNSPTNDLGKFISESYSMPRTRKTDYLSSSPSPEPISSLPSPKEPKATPKKVRIF